MKKIHQIWQQLSDIGLKDSMRYRFQQRVKLSNQVSIVIAFIAFFYAVLDAFSYEDKAVFSMLTLLIFSSSIPLLNHLGFNVFSRLIISLVPPLSTLALNLSIKLGNPDKIGLAHYISPRMLIISMVVIPLVLFTSQELPYLIVALLVTLLVGIWGYDWAHDYLQIHIQDRGFETVSYGVIYEDIVLMLVVLLIALFFLRRLNYQYEIRTDRLLAEAKEKNQQLNEREIHLKQSLEEVEKSRQEDQRRSWEAKGLARFANLLRASADEERIYHVLLSGIVKYVEANQGGLYLVNEDWEGETEIALASCFAYTKEQHESSKFKLGEGLIGQCIADNQLKHLREIPETYIKIRSGLGNMSPRALVVVPISFQEHTEGAIELAFLEDVPDYKISFLQKLSENIGAIIANNKVNTRTKQLLEEARQMSSQLQTKELQTREHLEELELAQAEMARKEKVYLLEIQALEEKLQAVNASNHSS